MEVWHEDKFVSRATPLDAYANCFVRRNRPTTAAPPAQFSSSSSSGALGAAFSAQMAKPPPALEEEWYVSIDGDQSGPFSLAEAQRWVASKPFDAAAQVRAYAGVLKSAMAGFGGELLLEPGRFIIAQAGALLTRVLYVKRNGAKTFVVTDAGMNDLIRPSLYQAQHEIVPVALEGKPRVR